MPFRRLLNGVVPCRFAGKASTMSMTSTSDMSGGLPDPRRLIAVVYADMVGYSRLIGLDDLQTLERLRKLRSEVIDPALNGHGGRIVQTGGDSLLMVFNVIAHSGLSGSCSGMFAASTKRRTSSTEARLAFAVLTRERNAA